MPSSSVEFEDPLGRVVEEVAVVRDRDHGAAVLLQGSFQPRDRLGVQVVGRFVQQQQVRSSKEDSTESDAPALAPRERRHARVGRGQAQGVHGDVESALEVPGVRGVDAGSGGRTARLRSASKSASGSAIAAHTSLKRIRRSRCSAMPSATLPTTSFVGSSWGSCERYPTLNPGVSRASPVKPSSSPAIMRKSDDLPEPLAPITPILAPG